MENVIEGPYRIYGATEDVSGLEVAGDYEAGSPEELIALGRKIAEVAEFVASDLESAPTDEPSAEIARAELALIGRAIAAYLT